MPGGRRDAMRCAFVCVCAAGPGPGPGRDLRPPPGASAPGCACACAGETGPRRLSALLSRSLSLNVIYVRGALAASP